MMKYCLLRDCVDWDTIYGIIMIKDSVSVEAYEDAIKDIKTDYYNKGYSGYTVEDVLNDLADMGYEFDYIDGINGDLEV